MKQCFQVNSPNFCDTGDGEYLFVDQQKPMIHVKYGLIFQFRLFPVVGGIVRILPKDVALSGYMIPKGVSCYYPISCLYLGKVF